MSGRQGDSGSKETRPQKVAGSAWHLAAPMGCLSAEEGPEKDTTGKLGAERGYKDWARDRKGTERVEQQKSH